jgi:opacity protein-like surface antigen
MIGVAEARVTEAAEPMDRSVKWEGPTWRNSLGVSGGAGFGSFIFGGQIKHDFWFFNAHYGRIVSDRIADGSGWAGRWMFLGEVTVGREFHPDRAWAISLTPMARYLFESSERWVPFVEAGFGLAWTDIGEPDLGGDQQFSTLGGAGWYWCVGSNMAYTFQYRFVHYSNAGLRAPNQGVNVHAGLMGLSYFF